MKSFIARCREWQKQNPEWQLVCDIEDIDHLYTQWEDLSARAKGYWTGKYRKDAKAAFEEFGLKECKAETAVLDCNMNLCDEWPNGEAIRVYKIGPVKPEGGEG